MSVGHWLRSETRHWELLLFAAALMLGVLLASCADINATTRPTGMDMTGEEQAVHIVWTEVYGRTDRPPLVRWKVGNELTCTDPKSGKPGFHIVDLTPTVIETEGPVVCREGLTWSPLEVLVAYHGELSFSETSLAHELEHAELLRRGFWLENHHDRPDFFTRIDAANAALVAAGR